MSRTLGELPLGTSVWVDEYINGVQTPTEYYVMEHSNATQLLRRYAVVQKRMHSTNLATYADCGVDLWLLADDGFRSRFDDATKAVLESTVIMPHDIDGVSKELARDIYVPTAGNVGESTDEGTSWLNTFKLIANGATNNNTARIAYNESGSAVNWWLSSTYSETQFRNVNTGGGMSTGNASSGYNWVRPALSVASATIVSSDEEDTIYLLPNTDKLYREVSAKVIIGETEKRPKSARLLADFENLYETQYQISNNAGDISPTWVVVENGVPKTLSNTTKETENWVLGVKLYGKSNGRGVFHEPALLVELEV